MKKVWIPIALLVAAFSTVPVHGQGGGMAGYQQALDAVVARGTKAFEAGEIEQARAAWTLALALEPGLADVRKELEALKPAMFSLNEQERAYVSETATRSDSSDWCTFPEPTGRMEVIALRMLADGRLLPNLRVTNLSFRRPGCETPGVFLFVARSGMSMADVRRVYGEPQLATKKDDGSEVLTYGQVRLVGTSEGAIRSIVLGPFEQ